MKNAVLRLPFRSRAVAWAVAILAVSAAVVVQLYGLFWAGSAHLGLEAEFLEGDGFRVTYVMPVGLGSDAGIRLDDRLLEAEGGRIVERGPSKRLVNPSTVVVGRTEGAQVVSASDMQALTRSEADILHGMSLLFVVSASLAIVIRSWDPSSWHLFVFLYSAGLLLGLGVVSGQRGGMFAPVATMVFLPGMIYGAVSWLSVFPHRAVVRDWRSPVARLCFVAGLVVACAGAVTALFAPAYYPAVRYLIASYVALGLILLVAEVLSSTARNVPPPRRQQATWLCLVLVLSIGPAFALYIIPTLLGVRLVPLNVVLIGGGLLPIGALAVVMRYQRRKFGEEGVKWILRIGALYACFAASAFASAGIFAALVGSSENATVVAYTCGGLTAGVVVAAWAVARGAQQLGLRIWEELVPIGPEREIAIRDEEQRRLMQELHNGPLQTAAALALIERVPNATATRTELIERLVSELRTFVHTAPTEGLTRRLDEAVRALSQQVESLGKLAVTVNVIGRERLDRLPPEKGAALLHVVQVGLSNVVRHSGASEARVRVACSETVALVRVQDNGKGFDPASLEQSWDVPHGLALLRQRIELLGGDLKVDSFPGKGTVLEAQMTF